MGIVPRNVAPALSLLRGALHIVPKLKRTSTIPCRFHDDRVYHPSYTTIRFASRGALSRQRSAAAKNQWAVVSRIFQLSNRGYNKTGLTESTTRRISESTGIPERKVAYLNRWIYDHLRTTTLPTEVAEILQCQEETGGDISKLSAHMQDVELGTRKTLELKGETFPKLSDIGKISVEAATDAVCLMAEDKLIKGFACIEDSDAADFSTFVQLAEFAGFYYEVAAQLQSSDAALYLIRIANHPQLRLFWDNSVLSGPRLDFATRIVQENVNKDPDHCRWELFSTYMDLFYSADAMMQASRRRDANYFKVGIAHMTSRIRHSRFENLQLEIHHPRVHLPHKHLLRIINHCLRDSTLVVKDYPPETLKEMRQDLLQALAVTYEDYEANFTLAIECGNWYSEEFKHHLLRSLPDQHVGGMDSNHAYSSHAHWLIGLHHAEKLGTLLINPKADSSAISVRKADSETLPKFWLTVATHLQAAISYDSIHAEQVHPKKPWYFNRVLALAAIYQGTCDSPDPRELVHRFISQEVSRTKEIRLERRPYLRDQIKRIDDHLNDLESKDPKTERWQQRQFDEVLQNFADPRKLIQQLQEEMAMVM